MLNIFCCVWLMHEQLGGSCFAVHGLVDQCSTALRSSSASCTGSTASASLGDTGPCDAVRQGAEREREHGAMDGSRTEILKQVKHGVLNRRVGGTSLQVLLCVLADPVPRL